MFSLSSVTIWQAIRMTVIVFMVDVLCFILGFFLFFIASFITFHLQKDVSETVWFLQGTLLVDTTYSCMLRNTHLSKDELYNHAYDQRGPEYVKKQQDHQHDVKKVISKKWLKFFQRIKPCTVDQPKNYLKKKSHLIEQSMNTHFYSVCLFLIDTHQNGKITSLVIINTMVKSTKRVSQVHFQPA